MTFALSAHCLFILPADRMFFFQSTFFLIYETVVLKHLFCFFLFHVNMNV